MQSYISGQGNGKNASEIQYTFADRILQVACKFEGRGWSPIKLMLGLQENYGKDNESSITAIKGVFREINVESIFKQYEQESYERLSALISQQNVLPEEVFTALLKKIYKRQK